MSGHFSERSRRRIKEAVTRIERTARNTITRNRYPIFNFGTCYVYVTGTVTGMVGAQLGVGSGSLCTRSSSGALSAITPTITISNFDNPGSEFSGPCYVSLEWNTGNWSTVNTKCT